MSWITTLSARPVSARPENTQVDGLPASLGAINRHTRQGVLTPTDTPTTLTASGPNMRVLTSTPQRLPAPDRPGSGHRVYVRRWDLRPWRLPCAPIENRIMTQRELEDLPPDECFRLLATAHVGRLVYQDDLGPLAVPVNYAMAGHDIVFRVEGGAKRAAMQQPMLAFEVDHVDEDRESGWSVLVRGVGAEVDLERVPALLRAMDGHHPKPWAVGIHNVWLQIVPHTVTGRRLGAERSPMF